jgi:hypothetical protein
MLKLKNVYNNERTCLLKFNRYFVEFQLKDVSIHSQISIAKYVVRLMFAFKSV